MSLTKLSMVCLWLRMGLIVITHIEVDKGIVKKLLDEMNEYKAVGPDGISTKFLKECS